MTTSENGIETAHGIFNTNIDCVALNDLTTGLLKKPSMVESITINGHRIESGGKKFVGDAKVIISYHSFAGR